MERMKRYLTLSLLLSCSLFSVSWFNKKEEMKECPDMPRPSRMSVQYVTPNGIGYNNRYMSFDLFLSPPSPWQVRWTPFINGRLHGFSDGKWAGNFGVGSRVIARERVWGGNVYYDYRRARNNSFNQIMLGFESLGELVDVRLNGYFPIVDRRSPNYTATPAGVVPVEQRYQYNFWSGSAEIGFHVDQLSVPHFYFAAGPYYLNGVKETAWGGQGRACMDVYQYARIEGNLSYDRINQWVKQGRFVVSVPFGTRKRIPKYFNVSCDRARVLANRSIQRVDRLEIIPIDSAAAN
jgi:hypothetical protein